MTLSWEISNGIFPDLNVLDSYQSVKCVKVLVKSSVFRHGFHNPPHAVLGPVLPAAAWSRGSGYSQESYEWGAETLAKPQTSAPPLHYSSFTLSCWNGPCCCQWTCVGLWWGLRWEILSENPMGSVPDNCILIPDYCPCPISRVLSDIPWPQTTCGGESIMSSHFKSTSRYPLMSAYLNHREQLSQNSHLLLNTAWNAPN